ncbi:glycosyltransferase family 4 protein [Sphingomonas sp. HHU CXW]|uniref:Glycosyltransferase family 4 protein n=2 Tax=Sphingomonas hominis TaxID=2741495 RepID=A0ABX2JKD0_9SPHN|nr:glycosyltransferase family 4 protein [Sphingomonas hominis]NTS66259.1 glycosyltransferase family 4 protein [Sphingomonas hominis]
MTADAVGGVWQYALELAAALAPLGVDAHLALIGPAPSSAQRDRAAALGVTYTETGLPLDWLAQDAAEVRRTADAVAMAAALHGADVVQLNQPAFALADYAMPIVAVAHSCVASWWDAVERGPLPTDLAWQAALTGDGLARADVSVCPSAALAGTMQRLYALPRRPQVVHNGRTAIPSTGALADHVFTAGRLWDRGKDAATLDRAAARVSMPIKAAGPLAGPHGEQVAFAYLDTLGSLSDAAVADHLSAGPIFASATRYEPFGLAVLEAASAGCALVLSDIPTFRELWDGAATFVTPGDDEAFARAIEALASDATARIEAGERARARAARYTPAANARGMADIYARAVAPRERVAA